ncbi:MAG: winged helix-turn-helix domain-containing protein [Nitriliruptorales bacterium]
MLTLSPNTARRTALAAQSLVGRPSGRVDVRHLRRVLDTLHVVQLDSVNVLTRAHYLPFFSRLGPYRTDRLDDLLWRSGEAFEYLGHEASITPVRLHPLLRHRRERSPWQRVRELLERDPGYLDRLRDAVRARGPVTAGDLRDPDDRRDAWWGWTSSRLGLDWLYMTGELAVAERDQQFTVHYHLPERVLPEEVLAAPDVSTEVARARLLELAAVACGVATAGDLADYWHMRMPLARPALAALVDDGVLRQVHVAGWREPAYMRADIEPRRRPVRTRALLAPFDPLVWTRDRAERLFEFRYRIEIYVPKDKRRFGYYVLPFLLDDRLVARVDLKADRGSGRLLVRGAFSEDGYDRTRVASELADELALLSQWQGLDDIEIADRGDLAGPLATAMS